jgi:hypothetical protein
VKLHLVPKSLNVDLYIHLPVTVAERSVFARLEAEIVGSNPTQGMDVWYVCVVLCLGSGLATS